MAITKISVRGARQHNLKNIDVEIPRNTFTVVTGLSGSGKSSLAFDTIYAEGQRRYVETLSTYARQFLDQMERPDVDAIDGLSPSISIEQKTTSRSPRSTVGTITEIYDYLRLLFASIGIPHCPRCGRPISRQTAEQIVQRVMMLTPEDRVMVLAPIVRGRKGEFRKEMETLLKHGYERARVDGELVNLDDDLNLDKRKNHTIEVVIDRLLVKPGIEHRLEMSVGLAMKLAGGLVQVAVVGGEETLYSEKLACPDCGINVPQLEPRSFSFNSMYGACPECHGLGSRYDFDPAKVITDWSKPLLDGGLGPGSASQGLIHALQITAAAHGIDLNTPFEKFPEKIQDLLLNGESGRGRTGFRGIFGYLKQNLEESTSEGYRDWLMDHMSATECPACQGKRLRPESLAVKVNRMSIAEFTALPISRALEVAQGFKLTGREEQIAGRVMHEIRERLQFLSAVGLNYISLDRSAATLSGGEGQRIRLATQIGSKLRGVLYVLDEPSIGLHSRDTHRLIKILHGLRDLGNTILVVEHDPDIMRAADRILDLGPGAGESGGKVIGSGTFAEIKNMPQSLTGRYLANELHIQIPPRRRAPGSHKIKVTGARAHNLKRIDLEIPLDMLVAITGVSGSGKSSLLHDVLYQGLAAAKRQSNGSAPHAVLWDRIDGADYLDEVVLVDQSPIGRTPRSNPVTYIKAFDIIRELFAALPEAKKRGFSAGHFSFNVPGGRCENCQGDGTVTVEMQFLADVELICDECKGTRYKPQVLEVRYKGKNIHEVLNLTIREGLKFFADVPRLTEKLRVLDEVGLGYLRFGQSATTLSGGEAQRMKLAAHLQTGVHSTSRSSEARLSRSDGAPGALARQRRTPGRGEWEDGETHPRKRRMLYIFDEPTTGLHFDDVSKLLFAFRRLIDAGGSILVIEHNLEVIKTADWVIDLGPEGGDRGGQVVGAGPPERIAELKESYTGQYLKQVLNGNANGNK